MPDRVAPDEDPPAPTLALGHPHLQAGAPWVYLDQNQWVALAKAAHGRPIHPSHAEAAHALDAAARAGDAAFPLSASHYIETWKQGNEARRFRLAKVMWRLSRGRTVAHISRLVFPEATAALARLTGRDAAPDPIEPFGIGLADAYGYGDSAVPEGQWDESTRAMAEFYMLADPKGPHGVDASWVERYQRAQKFRDAESAFQEALHESGADAMTRSRYVASNTLVAANHWVAGAAIGLDISIEEFRALLDRVGPEGLIREIPTLSVAFDLRRFSHENRQIKWRDSDLEDLRALSVAAVYCDAVVTERHRAHQLKRGGVEERFGTAVFTTINEVVSLIDE